MPAGLPNLKVEMLQEKFKNFYFYFYFPPEFFFKFGGATGMVSATTLCLWAHQA
jgi:hypothetical protein